MKAGTYWIGDLCYVMHEVWDEFCEDLSPGEKILKDGRPYAWVNTLHGDGTYEVSSRGETIGDLGVDAGLIGCIRVEHINQFYSPLNKENNRTLGIVVEFKEDFTVSIDANGTIKIGHVEVFTGDDEDTFEEENYNDDWSEEDYISDDERDE